MSGKGDIEITTPHQGEGEGDHHTTPRRIVIHFSIS
jgi:hypothetical protein